MPDQMRDSEQVANIAKGGYILAHEVGELEAIIIATGSEVDLAMQAHEELTYDGIGVRVVSMPCCERFLEQDEAYRQEVLPNSVRNRVAVEAGQIDYWFKFVGLDGKVIGMTTFGESAPAKELYQHFGITKEAIVDAVSEMVH